MSTSSRRVGPTYDTLRIVIQPRCDRTTFSATRLHFDGSQRTDVRIASGALTITPADLAHMTTIGLMERVLDVMRAQAAGLAAPSGATGGNQPSTLT